MRIALVSTVHAPVHPECGGSIEQLVCSLSCELARLGHQVTVFGVWGSEPCGELVATLPGTYGVAGAPEDWHLCEWVNLCRAVEQSDRFDVLHSHAYLWGTVLQPFSRAPLVHTTHVMPRAEGARLWALYPAACVTAISAFQWRSVPDRSPAAVIHHGLDPAAFTFRERPDNYVCFLGRFHEGKGVLEAIAAARALGLRTLLAGPRNNYFRRHVEPLVDGRSVEYVGWVSGHARDRLLGGARALLCPLRSPEPFGLVMPEAMMCGTPVAAIGIGAVPEIVDEGITGAWTPSIDGFPQAIARALTLDRSAVRARAEARFSADRMAREYVAVYEQVLSAGRTSAPATFMPS